MSRIYIVADTANPNDGIHLVRAATQAQAVNKVVSDRYSVRVASQDDIVAALSGGVKVVDAKAQEGGE